MNRLAYRCLAAVGLLAAALSFSNVQAQQAQQVQQAKVGQQVHSISTCPGEDCSNEMIISWGADTSVQSWLLWSKASDKGWRRAKRENPIWYRTEIYNGKSSKRANNENFFEDVIFNKCRVKLSGLEPNTTYKYMIVSSPAGRGTSTSTTSTGTAAKTTAKTTAAKTSAGDTSTGAYTFKTAGAKEWSACIISDFHNYSPIPGRLEAADKMIGKIKEYDPSMDWVLHLGDICAWGGSYSFWKNLYGMQWFKDYMWAGVNGNHDNMSRKYELTNEYFRNSAAYPLNGYPGEMGVCYWFKYGEALFIMLNNESMRTQEGLEDAQEWFKSVIKSNPSKYIIVCEHYQWFFGTDGADSQIARWSKLFDEFGVDLALAGNNHIYVRTNALYNKKETDGSRGTVYIQTPSSDNERGQAMKPELTHNKEIIKCRWTEGPKTVGAMSIKVFPTHIELALLDRNGTVIDTATVNAKR
ncbi:MAG: metallophosphoesterase family protein [bacterium]|nr:metallophosphoesterase family protein [bacterium]MDY2649826.1 metallophosphoesterase family protein [Candidatus Egerieousia sp.]